MTKNCVFLTGSTGLVGSQLLRIFLEKNYKIYILVRKKNKLNVEERINEVLKFLDLGFSLRGLNNLIILEGDISEDNLGLSAADVKALMREVRQVYHCAADVRFNLSLQQARDTNVKGTKNILELILNFRNKNIFERVNYLSTVFISGKTRGSFDENMLDLGQGFNSTYEQTKFEAEMVVENFRKNIWIDVFRPPLVVGESKTGKIISLQHSFYQVLRLLSSGLFEYFPSDEMRIHSVFVDDLSKGIYTIASKSCISNRNYHMFHQGSISLGFVAEILRKYFGFKTPIFTKNRNLLKKNLSPVQRSLLGNNIFLYNTKVAFLSNKTNSFLDSFKFHFTKLDKNGLIRLIRFAANRGYLKNNG